MKNDIEVVSFNESLWAAEIKLPDSIIDYFWKQIEVAKNKNIDVKDTLAGNISSSLLLEDPEKVVENDIFPSLERTGAIPFWDTINQVFSRVWDNQTPLTFQAHLSTFWVNFQKKYEFNPLHKHLGMFSFVVWMKIPYSWEDEKESPLVKGTTNENAVGNFQVIYPAGGTIGLTSWQMSPKLEGTMLLFPSNLMHMVNPFYTSDEERITISGNVYYSPPLAPAKQSKGFGN